MKKGLFMRNGIFLFVLLLQPLPCIFGQEAPILSSPARPLPGSYPMTIGGAPEAKGFAYGSPKLSNQVHGWRLPVNGLNRLVRVTEIIRAPAPCTWRSWNRSVTLEVSPTRGSCQHSWQQSSGSGWIENSWMFEPCDPRGWYSFEIYFDGRLASTIPFEVR